MVERQQNVKGGHVKTPKTPNSSKSHLDRDFEIPLKVLLRDKSSLHLKVQKILIEKEKQIA